jgi:hypothetical protein
MWVAEGRRVHNLMGERFGARDRIVVQPAGHVSARQQRELDAFARYCIFRLEHELGASESWLITVEAARGSGYSSHVVVRVGGRPLEGRATGRDAALATWNAICRLEQALREHRGSVRAMPC